MDIRAKHMVAAGLVVLAVVVVYWNGLAGDFFFDDAANILQVEPLQLTEFSLPALREAWHSGVAGPSGRPVAQISFALNHYFSGFDPFAFKLTNLVIHLLAGVLIFFTAKCLRMTPALAGWVAALWLLHPIQLTSVLYVVQRMTSLATLFVLAGFLLHLIGRERGGRFGLMWLVLAWCVCWPLAFFSKEIGALFPLLVLAWELTLRRAETGGLDRLARGLAWIVAASTLLGAVYLFLPAGQWLLAGYAIRDFSLAERLLTEGRVVWFYLGLVLLPRLEAFGLQHDEIAISTDLLTPWTTLPALFGIVALAGLIWFARKRLPLFSFGIAWFLIGHSLESTVLPLEIAHEHRNYLPLFGVLIALASLLDCLMMCIPGWKRTLGWALAVTAVAYCALLTGLRAHMYGDEVRRTQIEAQYHPQSSRAHYEAGRALAVRAVESPANDPLRFFVRSHYEKAAELDPNAKLPWLGLIQLNCSANLPLEADWLKELQRRLRETPMSPGDRTVLFGVKEMAIAGTLCLKREEIAAIFAAAQANPTLTPHVAAILYSWLADYLTLVVRDLPAAQSALDKSLAIAPYNSSNQLKRAQLAYLQGRRDEAREILNHIPDATLAKSERETRVLLLDCIASGDEVKCLGR